MTVDGVRFGTGTCWLGSFLVATTERGICALTLGDASEPLVEELRAHYPGAERADAGLDSSGVMASVLAFLEDPTTHLDLPLDLHGTAFQKRVWQVLQEVPPGATLTYTELAQRIGAERAVRAVAAACGANPVAVVVPCHRVIAKGGDLRGYHWGLQRKRALLERERPTGGHGGVQEPLPGF